MNESWDPEKDAGEQGDKAIASPEGGPCQDPSVRPCLLDPVSHTEGHRTRAAVPYWAVSDNSVSPGS